MQSPLNQDQQSIRLPGSCLIELTVGVQLASPWACLSHGSLIGVEVDDARAFARWLGRPIRFEILDPRDIPQALANAEIDLAIGGLQGDLQIRDVALSCRYAGSAEHREAAFDSPRLSHVWAIPRSSPALFASLAFYLWMVRAAVPEADLATVH
jgi:ABC-type amino acid transport substrate-binding protein